MRRITGLNPRRRVGGEGFRVIGRLWYPSVSKPPGITSRGIRPLILDKRRIALSRMTVRYQHNNREDPKHNVLKTPENRANFVVVFNKSGRIMDWIKEGGS